MKSASNLIVDKRFKKNLNVTHFRTNMNCRDKGTGAPPSPRPRLELTNSVTHSQAPSSEWPPR